MKKTIYGVVVAVLGAVLGAGAVYLFGMGKPAAPSPAVVASAPAAAAPVSTAKTGDAAAGTPTPAPTTAPAPGAGAAPSAAAPGKGAGGAGTPVEMGKPEKLIWQKSVLAVGSLRSDESVIVRAEQRNHPIAPAPGRTAPAALP